MYERERVSERDTKDDIDTSVHTLGNQKFKLFDLVSKVNI